MRATIHRLLRPCSNESLTVRFPLLSALVQATAAAITHERLDPSVQNAVAAAAERLVASVRLPTKAELPLHPKTDAHLASHKPSRVVGIAGGNLALPPLPPLPPRQADAVHAPSQVSRTASPIKRVDAALHSVRRSFIAREGFPSTFDPLA